MKHLYHLGITTTFLTGFVLLTLLTFSPPAGAQSCGELGGDYCSQSGYCPNGYDSLGSSWDCNPCCKQQPPLPSCGALGGDYCSQSGYCPNGYDSLGSSWDCNPCCKQQPPLPSCGALGGDYCSQSGSCPGGYDSLGSSNDCHPCCKKQPPSGPSCGELGGNYCSQSGYCPNGYDSLGSSWDCNPCCKQMAPTYDNAKLVSHTIPDNMTEGQLYEVSVTMLNTGLKPWTPDGDGGPDGSGGYVLAVKGGVLIPVGTRFLLPPGKVVQPGEPHTFKFTIQAPFLDFATTELQMMHEGVGWFGELLSLFVGIIEDENPTMSMIRLSPASGPPGTFVTVDLVKSPGFDPGSQIRFSFGDPRGYPYSLVPVSSTWVDDTQMTFTVPGDAGCGSHFAAVEMWGTAASEPAQFQVTGPCDASRRNSFDVVTYNIQMLPDEACPPFSNGCHKDYRAPLIARHPLLQDHDAIVFVEAFSDSHRELIQRILRPQYPYQGLILGGDHGLGIQDGGVIILSKWPIETEAQHVFGICNGFADCHADKGVNYARINKAGQRYHVFGTHFDSGDDYGDISARYWQLLIMDQVIKHRGIPDSEPVLMAGDFNIDRNSSNGEYDRMLSTLNASQPPIQGLRFWTNPKGQWLDYVLYANGHLQPSTSWNTVLRPRDGNGGDLSDHYAVLGSFVFGISENLAVDSSKEPVKIPAKIPIANEPLETLKPPIPDLPNLPE